jgi:hypothetical protein
MRSTAQASPTPTPSGCSARGRLGRDAFRFAAGFAAARAGRRAGLGGLFFFFFAVVFFFVDFFGGAMAGLRGVALGPGRRI